MTRPLLLSEILQKGKLIGYEHTTGIGHQDWPDDISSDQLIGLWLRRYDFK